MSFPFLGVPAVKEQNPITLKVKLWNENNWESKIENSKWSRRAHLALSREHKYPATLLGSWWLGNWTAKTTWKWQTVGTVKSRKCLSVCNHFICSWTRWDVCVHGCFSHSLSASATKEWKVHWLQGDPNRCFRLDDAYILGTWLALYLNTNTRCYWTIQRI